jgi:hypothetical protein
MEKSIFAGTDELRSLIQYQPCGHFRSACRQIRTLLEVGLSIMADAPRKQSTASCAIGGFKRIMKYPSIFTHALAVMVRLLVSYQQSAPQNGSTQSAADTTAVSQRYAERCCKQQRPERRVSLRPPSKALFKVTSTASVHSNCRL